MVGEVSIVAHFEHGVPALEAGYGCVSSGHWWHIPASVAVARDEGGPRRALDGSGRQLFGGIPDTDTQEHRKANRNS